MGRGAWTRTRGEGQVPRLAVSRSPRPRSSCRSRPALRAGRVTSLRRCQEDQRESVPREAGCPINLPVRGRAECPAVRAGALCSLSLCPYALLRWSLLLVPPLTSASRLVCLTLVTLSSGKSLCHQSQGPRLCQPDSNPRLLSRFRPGLESLLQFSGNKSVAFGSGWPE